MAQFILRRSDNAATELPKTLRADHAAFLGRHREMMVTYGPIWTERGRPAGYVYQTVFPGHAPDAVAAFLEGDPFARAGVFHSTLTSDWHCGLSHRLPTMPVRQGMRGFFFHGTGKPNITEFRNTIFEGHVAHLKPKDESNCLARGFLTDAGGKAWLGSAMAYEFPDRAALRAYFRDEPYCVNGIYEHIDIYDWQRGVIA